ncbi:MAG: hypothetical protein A3G34_13165 [Candidatus Lindowbacteria bacterium RIFCSPLOWO2_12_FULL_62_27]|nr:MAG: hypothetical protein A3I06_14885 [Candidatus Lindowbacteria bacterium RIFCSPLOWO2_02_FULL_62_12]OGH62534.1 MAG: hypothetical protein A3G34_13165 [Candidatus Lindowbacteria bacterium RIFCSPLOWO2_12_FULL_62_27]
MKILIDNNLPFWWAAKLRKDGLEASHVIDCGLADRPDDDVRQAFKSEPILLISRDSDFWNDCPAGWSLIWVCIHNPRLADLQSRIYDTIRQAIRNAKPGVRCLVTDDGIIRFGEGAVSGAQDVP